VVAAGIRRVVACSVDADTRVSGQGFEFLRRHGVEVSIGVGRQRALRLNRAYFTFKAQRRPFVIMKAATSLDNRIAAASGVRTQLTSEDAQRHAHAVRAEVDALAVGSGTVLTDDPLLTVRHIHRARPLTRVLFDRRLRVPPSARVFSTLSLGPVIIISTPENLEIAPDRARALEAAGAEIQAIEGGDFAGALRRLAARDVVSLILEGGPALQQSAWDAGLVDAVHLYVAPRLLGPQGVAWLDSGQLSVAALAERQTVPLGPDVFMEGYVHGID
jgi:diaminohydroxyphosphoribosylaminopyrimidine deaminase/5-amino-6-(5-phosphoribosylamino)uracil reductase